MQNELTHIPRPGSHRNQQWVGPKSRTEQVGTEPDVCGRRKGISRLPEPEHRHAGKREHQREAAAL